MNDCLFSGQHFEPQDLVHQEDKAGEMELASMALVITTFGRRISLGAMSVVTEVFQVGIEKLIVKSTFYV